MILIKIVILNIMIVEKKEVNPNTYEEINIIIKIEYPNIEYNDWKRTKEFNTDNDICSILDKILTNLNCKRVYEGKRVIMTTYPVYQMFINEYYYYLIKIANQFIYNQYFDKLINCHIDNILFEVMNDFVQAPVKPYPKIKNKLPENKFIKYTTKDIFTRKETYIYENLRTLEKISSNNPNLLEELNDSKKKKIKKKKEVGVPISSMTFSFKKEK